MNNNPNHALDSAFMQIEGLTWFPWVGVNYADLPFGEKILVVGESHYSNKETPNELESDIAEYLADRSATRSQVEQTLISENWTTPTLTNLNDLLYSPSNKADFWSNFCYYNFVQRPMRYRQARPERPTPSDFRLGWDVFFKLIGLLQPDHVIFIGVTSSHQFNDLMKEWSIPHSEIECLDWINGTHTRGASIDADGRLIKLHWVRHCGSYFSTHRWREYLELHAENMMPTISKFASHHRS